MTNEGTLGVLEVLGGKSGFIRRKHTSYTPSDDDIYVGQRLIHKHKLRSGDEIAGEVGNPPGSGKSPPLKSVFTVNDIPVENLGHRRDFRRLSAQHPKEQLKLECGLERRGTPDPTNRIIDLFCPLGKGQRAMIVAPSKAGKTMVLQAIAEGIVKNYPNSAVFILLVDERPEEVTEMEACGYGEVVASSFDYPAERHVQVAEITLERARRRAEMGQDVVIILDSITRLARAYNTVEEQVIFEEFKGTGNSELVLSRELADRRTFPAIDLNASATRREELLLSDAALTVSHAMRRELSGMSEVDAMAEVLGLMKRTGSNAVLLDKVAARI